MNEPSATSPHILLVDDEPDILDILSEVLTRDGYLVTTAQGGNPALLLINQSDFDLIITDLLMPGLDGFELMEAAKEARPDTPVILLTGQGTLHNAVRAIQLGAYDLVTKPVSDLSVFRIAIKRALEKRGLLLAQRAYLRRIEEQNRTLTLDLKAAQRIQLSMIRSDFREFDRLLDVSYRYLPAENVGGDFFDVQLLSPARIMFYIADVAGHGVPAAMVTVFAKQAVNRILAELGASVSNKGSLPGPRALLEALSGELTGRGIEHEGIPSYLTIFLGILDFGSRRLTYSNGGHWPAPRLQRVCGTMERLELAGSPIGLVDAPEFEEAEVSLEKGDRLFMCTDGVTGTANSRKLQFGEQRLDGFLVRHSSADNETAADRMVNEVEEFRGGSVQADDVSLLIISLKN